MDSYVFFFSHILVESNDRSRKKRTCASDVLLEFDLNSISFVKKGDFKNKKPTSNFTLEVQRR